MLRVLMSDELCAWILVTGSVISFDFDDDSLIDGRSAATCLSWSKTRADARFVRKVLEESLAMITRSAPIPTAIQALHIQIFIARFGSTGTEVNSRYFKLAFDTKCLRPTCTAREADAC